MPSGIILSSSSHGTDEERAAAVEKVLTDNGYEVDKPEAQQEETPTEPKREDFATEEEFAEAQEAFEAEQEEATEKAAEEAERKRLEALPKKSRRQRAVEKATKDLQTELAKLRQEIAALKNQAKPGEQKTEAVATPKEPKRDDYETDKEFEDALFDYRYKLRRAKDDAENQQKRLSDRMTKNFTDYQEAVAAFKDEHDDWDEVVDQAIALPEAVYFAIVDLGTDGPAVTYYLGQHPEKLDDLAELTPYRAAIEIGRMADKLKAGGKPAAGAERPKPTRPKTNIPEPVKPVSTAATTSTLTSREAAQQRNFRAFKAAQRRGA